MYFENLEKYQILPDVVEGMSCLKEANELPKRPEFAEKRNTLQIKGMTMLVRREAKIVENQRHCDHFSRS